MVRHVVLGLIATLSLTSYAIDGESFISPISKTSQASRPNVLLLIAEDMSARVGAFGDPVAVTPSLDKLAAQGVRFPNTFTTAGVCAPSRAALILGMHQTSIGAHHMRSSRYAQAPYLVVPPAQVKAFPELLRRAGYYTFTSNKLDYQFSKVAAGTGPATIWDYEGDEPGWHRRIPGQPFFGMYHFNETHESRLFAEHPDRTDAASLSSPVMSNQIVVPEIYPDTPTVRATIAQQYNNIQRMDKRVGKLLKQLEQDGLASNTIVIWTTDHGDGLPRFKREIYDTGIKVPMIIRWPKTLLPEFRQSGGIDNQLVSFVDLAPTILNWAGVDDPGTLHGRPVLNSADDQQRQYVFAAKDRLDEHPNRERAVRSERYKYIHNYQPGTSGAQHIAYRDRLAVMQELWQLLDANQLDGPQRIWFQASVREALYDTQNDPYEINNLAEDPSFSAILSEMRKALADWQASIPDLGERAESELAQQFWPERQQPVTSAPMIDVEDAEDAEDIGHGHRIALYPRTEGASITYRLNDGNWQLYTKPFLLPPHSTLVAKSVRYGWLESPEVFHGQFQKKP